MNMPATEALEHVRALIDDPLRVARSAARDGARLIGYVGNDVPLALIAAAGALPVRMRGKANAATAQADQYLESAYSPEVRAIAEQWLTGQVDFVEAVVFPRTDDSAQRLYYYLCELQRRGLCAGPRPLLYDIANLDRPMSAEYTRETTRCLARELGTSDVNLAPALRRISDREALLADLRARRAAVAPLPGSLAWAWERASDCDWRESFDAMARHWLDDAPVLPRAHRLLLAGNSPPTADLHHAVENAGGSVVVDLTESTPGALHARSPHIDALADHFHARRNPVLAMRGNSRWVAECARDASADAVLFWLIEEDESMPWEIARQMRSLADAGIPTLLLSRQSWVPDADALAQVRQFVATLGAKP